MRAASKHKKLRIHTGTHYHPFYSEEGKKDQLRFWEHWLKGKDTGIMNEPPVKLLIRTGGGGPYQFRHENEWPLARTQWTRFYLRASQAAGATADGTLERAAPSESKALTYGATGMARGGAGAIASSTTLAAGVTHRMGISFETEPLAQDTEVTGPINLVLWVSSTTEDMDIFATIRNIDADGKDVWEVGQQGQQVPVAKGWLRASHRELDPELSLPYRPYHRHERRLPLNPGEAVECQVEIWPTCMVFRKGHRIRLDIQPRDGLGSAPYTHYHGDYNTGDNTIHTGGDRASYLLLPIIPPKA
jgi:putative CocE/NonD family hydrolase